MTPQVAFGVCARAPKLASSFPFCLHRGVRAGRLGFFSSRKPARAVSKGNRHM
jgi:hypothetical protein